MKERKKTVLFWAPRVISILFALFIAMFGFDVFSMGIGFPEIILAFIMDMMPAILVVVMIILAWKWELVGAIICLGLALFYIFGMNNDIDFIVFLLIPLPLFVLSVLWFLGWRQKKNE